MPCFYQSVTEVEIKDHEMLMRALERMDAFYQRNGEVYQGYEFTIRIKGELAEVISQDSTFGGRLKQAYGVEMAKKEAKKRGYRVKEVQQDGKIRLVVTA